MTIRTAYNFSSSSDMLRLELLCDSAEKFDPDLNFVGSSLSGSGGDTLLCSAVQPSGSGDRAFENFEFDFSICVDYLLDRYG